MSEFVANEGLGCLLDVGQKCDQTCQQYILKGEHHTYFISNDDTLFDVLPYMAKLLRGKTESDYSWKNFWSSIMLLDLYC